MRGLNGTFLIFAMYIIGILLVCFAMDGMVTGEVDNDFNYMSASDFNKDMYVDGEVIYSLGCFSESQLQYRSIGATTGGMYLVPVGVNGNDEGKYIGVFVGKQDFEIMDEITADTVNFVLGKKQSMDGSPTLSIKGKVKTYGTDEKEFLYDYMKQVLGTDSRAECDKYIVQYYIDYEGAKNAYMKLIIGIVLILIPTLIIIGKIRNSAEDKKRAKAIANFNAPQSNTYKYTDNVSENANTYSDNSGNTYSYEQSNEYTQENTSDTIGETSTESTSTSKFRLKE